MSFGFMGIQFGFALQNANASSILLTFGADIHQLSWFWLVAPITGIIVHPIVGYFSDRTWNKLGRRRPYFLAGAILTSTALILMPNAPHLATAIAPMFIGGGMLMIMDASMNLSMEPFRALVADKLPAEQHALGFSMQTLLIGIGAVAGSLLPYILGNWWTILFIIRHNSKLSATYNTNDRDRDCMGKHIGHAIRYVGKFFTAKKNGDVYGVI